MTDYIITRFIMAFVDLEKAFYRVNRRKLWSTAHLMQYPKQLINVINHTYNDAKIKTGFVDE